jgi:hypothetical protein
MTASPSPRQANIGRCLVERAHWAPLAATLPQAHVLVEPYLYNVIHEGQYHQNRTDRGIPREDDFRC